MAYRVDAGDASFRSIDCTKTDARGFLLRPPSRGYQRYATAAIPIVFTNDDCSEYDSDETSPHPRPWNALGQRHERAARDSSSRYSGGTPEREWSPEPEHHSHQFFVIREGTPSPVPGGAAPFQAPPPVAPDAIRLQPHHHHFHLSQQHRHQHRRHDHQNQQHAANIPTNSFPMPSACSMERTPSGRTILTEATAAAQLAAETFECADFSPEEDREAALQVKRHMYMSRNDVRLERHSRILRALIHPKPHAAKETEFPLDNDALESIFSAADKIFFQGRLSRRVHWEWSSFEPSSEDGGGDGGIIGTTSLRRAPSRGGYETLIMLSSPILMDTNYNRRLLISTFLHELIHSYLFICCGFKARQCGGHTEGFKAIASMIDDWAGWGTLWLSDMKVDLEYFREGREKNTHDAEYGRSEVPMNHYHRQQQQQQQPSSQPQQVHVQHRHQQAYHHQEEQQQQPPQQRRYHHHGGVDFYDLNEGPWITGPRVHFGNHQTDHHHPHAHHHHQPTSSTSSFATLVDSPVVSCSPPPGCNTWNYPPRIQTPFSSPTPPPSMSITPLSSATTLVGSDVLLHGGQREDSVMYEYDREGPDGSGAPQQQYCHMFTGPSEMKYYSSPPM